jgi:hypothetical protein
MIIGIVGVAGSGKTIVARHLVEVAGYRRLAFAAPLKRMLKAGLGLTDEQLDGDHKQRVDPVLGSRTPRYLMQTLGTEWGRRMVGPDVWSRVWTRDAAAMGGNIVADDVRFSNEADAIRALGGVVWRVHRPGLMIDQHASERAGRRIEEDELIMNATSIPELIRSVDALIGGLVQQQKETTNG